MASQSKGQKDTMQRVMHEFKEGKLTTGQGKKVTTQKQAVAIGLHESGSSKYETKEKNEQNLQRTKAKERKGKKAEKK